MQTLSCRLCGHLETAVALVLPGSPRNIQNLLKTADLAKDSAVDLTVIQCKRCSFVQLPPVLEDTYYDDYLMGTTHSLQMQKYQQRQAGDFVARVGLHDKKVFEAGCGDGSFSVHLQQAGARVFGIEPSHRFRQLALAKGLAVEAGYVTASRVLPQAPFDGFVTRQVLEHVPDIHDFLTGIRFNLADGAVGLIEVPSLEKALADNRYYDFFADHVNYFSLPTLALALQLNGFEIIETLHDMFGEYNVALVRAAQAPNLAGIQRTSTDLAAELRLFVDSHHAKKQKVAVWGAGGKGLSVMATAGIKHIDLMVDSDTFKQGMHTPVSHFLVQAPSPELLRGIDAVIVTAMAYRAEIEATLRGPYAYTGTLAFLGQHLEVVPESRATERPLL